MSKLARVCLAMIIAGAWFALAASAQEENIVVVDNTTSVINGDTTDIPSLIAHPGSDGISFAEAFKAASAMTGKKVITFNESLIGKTIEVTTTADDRRLFVFDTPDITILGDLDGNGTPDVTLAAARGSVLAFVIRSSRTTIEGIHLITGFDGAPITFACLDFVCDDHLLRGIRILDNEIVNLAGPAIEVSIGPPRSGMIPYVGDLFFDDLQISGNEISAAGTGVSMSVAVQGFSNERARAVTISRNKINAPAGIRIIAADGTSAPDFSDNNTIENLTIDQNTIQTSGTAIKVFAANFGNSNNRITGLQITGNQIEAANGIDVAASGDGKPQRIGSGNIIENLTIAGNQIKATGRGIAVSAADLPASESSSAGFDSNRVRRITIRDNTVSGYSDAGVRVWGAVANNGTVTTNALEDVSVANNVLTAGLRQAFGIGIVGGDGKGGSARNNAIRTLSITGNRASGGAVGVVFIGGNGPQAVSNTIEVLHFSGNDLQANDIGVSAIENQGGGGNAVRFPRRRAVR
ncbi:MAG TPA: hypothetical protein VLV78_09735 [Thermoanaerobaculia bacterium]|nr:hypothetical protein [Thermoanaerobaculia bacterium]